MVFGKSPEQKAREQEIKRGEEVLKDIVGGKLLKKARFSRLVKANGMNTEKTAKLVKSTIKTELKNGSLKADDVEDRIYEIVKAESPYGRLISVEEAEKIQGEKFKAEILRKGKIAIQIPYQASGVGGSVRGGTAFGQTGAFLGSYEEGMTKWKATELLFIDDGISIKSTGQVALYNDITKVVLGERGFAFTVVTVITENGNNLVFKSANDKAVASKLIIEDNIVPKIPQQTQQNSTSNQNVNVADELLKYAELCEKGFLTKEEFDMKKAELLGANDNDRAVELESPNENYSLKQNFIEENNIRDQLDDKPNFCSSCGSPIDSDSKFCTNCGAKIN